MGKKKKRELMLPADIKREIVIKDEKLKPIQNGASLQIKDLLKCTCSLGL